MKNRFLFLVGIGALLAMSSCSKDEENLVVKSGEPATLSLTIKGSDLSTKATVLPGDLTTAGVGFDNTITRVTVGLFKQDANGTTDVIQEGTLDNNKIEVKGSIVGTDASRDIVVVANANSGDFKGCSNKSAFLATIMNLTQDRTLLPMVGTSSGVLTKVRNTGTTGDGLASVVVTRLVARVQLVSLKTAFDLAGQYPNAKFTATQIFMFNAVDKLTAGEAVVPTAQFLDGRTYKEGTSPVVYPLLDPVNQEFPTVGEYKGINYFYTFPNGLDAPNYAKSTRLVIGGTFDPDGGGPANGIPTYYPVIVNYFANPTAAQIPANGYNNGIVKNTIYSISVTIKNKGVDSPDIIIDPGYLDVSVTVAPWLSNDQSVDF